VLRRYVMINAVNAALHYRKIPFEVAYYVKVIIPFVRGLPL
jgi:hypothetical protein